MPSPCKYLTFSSCPRGAMPGRWVSIWKALIRGLLVPCIHPIIVTAPSKGTWMLGIRWHPWAGLIPIVRGWLERAWWVTPGRPLQHFEVRTSGLCSKLLQGFMPTKDRTECAFRRDDYGDSIGLELEGGKTGVRRESSRRIAEQFKGETTSPALLRIYPRQRRSTPNHLG